MSASRKKRNSTSVARKPAERTRAGTAPEGLGLVLDDAAARAETDKMLAEREPLFTVGGVTYTIPKQVPPSWTVKAFSVAASEGEAAALAFAAEKLLTEEAWLALQECETVTPAAWKTIFAALVDRILPGGGFGPKA